MTTVIDLGKLRFYWAGLYNPATQYELNDVVRYGGNVYVYINIIKTIGNVPTNTTYWALMVEGINFAGEWSSVTQYYIGDAVAYGSTVYVSLQDNINKRPDLFPAFWSQFVEAIQWEGDYSAVTSYQANDVVKYGGSAYIAKQTTSGNLPTDTTYWAEFVTGISPEGIYNNTTAYVPNDIVAYGANLYICIANTTGNNPTNATYWTFWVSAFQNRGAWVTATLYYVNDLIQYGANAYACQVQNTSANFETDLQAGKWSLFTSGLRQRGPWTTTTSYLPFDIIVYGGNTYSCLLTHTSGTFATDLAAGKWQVFNSGVRWRGSWVASTVYLTNDIVRNLGSSYIATQDFTSGATFSTEVSAGKWVFFAQGADDVLPVIVAGDQGYSLSVSADGANIAWLNASGSTNVFYVSPNGNNSNPGNSLALPFASIQTAVAAVPAGQMATIFVKTGTYQEALLPIVVPPNVAIIGDSQRTTIVTPASGLAADGVTANNQATMFQVSNGTILNRMTFSGMTGWVPGGTPGDITTSTAKGVVIALNPSSAITTKSPYILECTAIGSGCIGALADGSVHATGNKSMLWHAYTVITDNGVGYWVKDGARGEIVSCFTYYAYFGYAASGGGILRSLNGNNSYGTWGAKSFGSLASETPQTGTLYGKQLTVVQDPITAGFTAGATITGLTSGATGVVTNLQSAAGKVYYNQTSVANFSNSETISDGTYTLTITSTGVSNQKGFLLVANGFTSAPLPGASIQIAGDSSAYVIGSVSGTYVDSSSVLSIVLVQEKVPTSAPGAALTIRYKYSQIRLTGHDFLNIGTGGISTTNYPNTPTQSPAQGNEVEEALPGRVYYVATDQDGNFRVGEYFRVDQGTGTATLNANAFNLSGLTSLQLGSIGAQLGETINEFSSDSTLGGNFPTNIAVPTEAAVKTYVDNNSALKSAVPSIDMTSSNYSASYSNTLLNVTTSADYRSIVLPSALTDNYSNAKFQIRNTSAVVIGVRDNDAKLLTAIKPGGGASISLTSNTTAAGTWIVTGDQLQPFFIDNATFIENGSATAGDNNPSTSPIFNLDLDSTRTFYVHNNATGTISAYAVDYSATPATTSTPLVYASGSNYTIIGVRKVSTTRVLVFTLTDVILFNITGTTVTTITQSNGLYTSPVRTGYSSGSSSAVMKFDDEFYGVMFGGAANGIPVLTVVKVDGNVIRAGTLSLSNNNAVVNGWDAIATSSTTCLMVYGDYAQTTAAPWWLRAVRITVTKGSTGVNPSASTGATGFISGSALASAAAYSISVAQDTTNSDRACVIFQNNTTTTLNSVVITGATTGSFAVGSILTVDTLTTNTSTQFGGATVLSPSLRSAGSDVWLYVYQGTNNYVRVARITSTSATLPTYHAKGAASGIYTLTPNYNSNTVFLIAQGQPTTSFSGVFSYTNQSGTFQYKSFVSPNENILPTSLRSYAAYTSDGWILHGSALQTTATTSLVQHNNFALYKVDALTGNIVYYGIHNLPLNLSVGIINNAYEYLGTGEMKISGSSIFYDYAKNIPFRIAASIEFIKT